MNNQLTVINQDAKIVLAKTKSLIDITNKILANRSSKELVDNYFNLPPFILGTPIELGVEYSLSNDRLIIDGDEGAIVFNLSRARLIGVINNQEWGSFNIITNDNKYILTYDSEYKIFDIESGYCIITFKNSHTRPIITTDNKIIFCENYYKISVLDIDTKETVKNYSIPDMSPRTIKLSPNEKKLVVCCEHMIQIFNLETNEYFEIKEFNSAVSSAKITLDSKYIFAGSNYNRTISMYDLETGELKKLFEGQSVLSISPNGKFLASKMSQKGTSSINDYTLKVWNTETGECCKSSTEHNLELKKIILFKNEETLASMDAYGGKNVVKIWDIESGNCIATINEKIKDFAINLDDNNIIYTFDRKFFIYDILQKKIIKEFKTDSWYSILYSSCEQMIIYNSSKIQSYDLNTEKVLWVIELENIFDQSIKSEGFSYIENRGYGYKKKWECIEIKFFDGNILIVENKINEIKPYNDSSFRKFDHIIAIWDIETKSLIKTFNLMNKEYYDCPIVITPDKSKIIIANKEKKGQLQIFDMKANIYLKTIEVIVDGYSNDRIYSIIISPDSRFYVTFDDYLIKIWDFEKDEYIFQIRNQYHHNRKTCIFSSDSKRIFFPCAERIEIWDIKGNYIKTIGAEISGALFLSNEELVVFNKYDIKTWNLNNSIIKKTVKEENSFLIGISSNKFVIKIDTQNVIGIFNIENGDKLYSIYRFSNTDYVLIDSNGYFNASNKEVINKYIRINDDKNGARMLTNGEINYFSKEEFDII